MTLKGIEMTKCTSCGADSATADFCDQCGAALTGAPAAASSTPAAAAAPAAVASSGDCPHCGEARVGDAAFCEACGYDFVNGKAPQAAEAKPAQAVTPAATTTGVTSGAALWAIVTSDEAWFKRMEPQFEGNDFQYPSDCPARQFPLDADEVRIGRKAVGGVDLSSEPRDGAVSGNHARLVRQADGSYQLIDGSTNGTYLNGADKPVDPGVPVDVKDGDYINLGAWTRITFQKR